MYSQIPYKCSTAAPGYHWLTKKLSILVLSSSIIIGRLYWALYYEDKKHCEQGPNTLLTQSYDLRVTKFLRLHMIAISSALVCLCRINCTNMLHKNISVTCHTFQLLNKIQAIPASTKIHYAVTVSPKAHSRLLDCAITMQTMTTSLKLRLMHDYTNHQSLEMQLDLYAA